MIFQYRVVIFNRLIHSQLLFFPHSLLESGGHEAELEKEERAKKLQEMLDDERIAGWIQKWERVKIERVAALRKHLEWCRLSPETTEERRTAKN